MSYKTTFFEALADFVEKHGFHVTEVAGFKEEVEWAGGCETCDWEKVVVYIFYSDDYGNRQEFRYEGTMAEFITELTEGGA